LLNVSITLKLTLIKIQRASNKLRFIIEKP
jgi:hypothetical protein